MYIRARSAWNTYCLITELETGSPILRSDSWIGIPMALTHASALASHRRAPSVRSGVREPGRSTMSYLDQLQLRIDERRARFDFAPQGMGEHTRFPSMYRGHIEGRRIVVIQEIICRFYIDRFIFCTFASWYLAQRCLPP